MARAIRFTRAERDALAGVLEFTERPVRTSLERLLAKMDKASAPATPDAADFRAVPAVRFVQLAREELGARVFVPPAATREWWSRLQRSLKEQGIDEEGARNALAHVATWARQPQDPQSLARNASRYLAASRPVPRTEEPADEQADDGMLGRPPELR